MSARTAGTTIDVIISAGVHCADLDALKEAIAQHICSRIDLIRDLNVHATVTECVCEPGHATFAVALEGQINGELVTRKVRAVRSPRNLQYAGSGTAFGVGEVVNRLVVGVASGVFGVGEDAENLLQCFTECIAELSLTIDSLIGHQESSASQSWKKVSLARWIAAAAAMAWVTAPFVMRGGPIGFLALFMPGMLLGPSVFLLVHVAGLALMPTVFFQRDPRGQKELARSGVNNVVVLRIICAVLAAVFIGVIVFCTILSVELLPQAPAHAG